MSDRNRLPCRKPHALHTAPRRAFAGIAHFHSSTMAAFAAVTIAIVALSAMGRSLTQQGA